MRAAGGLHAAQRLQHGVPHAGFRAVDLGQSGAEARDVIGQSRSRHRHRLVRRLRIVIRHGHRLLDIGKQWWFFRFRLMLSFRRLRFLNTFRPALGLGALRRLGSGWDDRLSGSIGRGQP
jgi:hypothetical protein